MGKKVKMRAFALFSLISLLLFKEISTSNIKLTDKNWEEMLEGEWMVKFYAPWCPACRAVTSTWNEFAIWAKEEHGSLSVGSVDVTAQGELNGRFMVTSLPTIYHVRNGEFRQYSSSRTMTEFKDFITEQKWRTIQPMSSWLDPNSITMTGVSKLFSFSMKLKDFHESLRNEYGLPGWASMLLFGLVVVVIGLCLGIGLVVGLDWFFGPQQETAENMVKKEDTEIEGDEDSTKAEKEIDEDSTVRKRNVPVKENES